MFLSTCLKIVVGCEDADPISCPTWFLEQWKWAEDPGQSSENVGGFAKSLTCRIKQIFQRNMEIL
jgi:hypothetical protein